MLFAALRFYKDANISDRLYWYLSDFPVKEGERVFAPVGVHDRLQRAIVERVKDTAPENAPYDLTLIKKIAGSAPAPELRMGNFVCRDLGGVSYDEKHYTRFQKIYFTECGEEPPVGFFDIVLDNETVLSPLAESARVLIAGIGAREYAENIIRAARGEDTDTRFKTLAERLK